jgi:hypothetical protein
MTEKSIRTLMQPQKFHPASYSIQNIEISLTIQRAKIVSIICKNQVLISKKTHQVLLSIMKLTRLMAFKNNILICSKIQLKLINTLCGRTGEFFKVKPDGRNAYYKPVG